ncbi:MAG: hypothetical protein Q7J98_14630 [Kiritimatiellia bacterium]|nr:hypothetical protein [Kiritimatiellia bacterium]
MTTSRHERIIIWIALAALAVFTIFCIFWTPCDQSKLLRPIPANAIMISSHRNLGPRLESMATNIFLKALFGSDETAVKNLRKNHYTARILASRLIIMAYVPDFNHSSNPALVISSWVGGWTPILRWALWLNPPKDIAPLGEHNGHRLWAYKKPVSFFGAVNYFSFAVDEGVFIGCLSQDRSDITHLLRIYDGQAGSILSIPQSKLIESVSASAADQVWLRVELPNAVQNKTVFAVCSLDTLENDYLAATIRFEPAVYANATPCQNQGLAEIGKFYACSPSAVALFPSDMVGDGLNGFISPAWAGIIKPIIAPLSDTNNVCLLTVFTGDYGGNFGKEPFRIAVPTFLLAVSGARQDSFRSIRVKQTKAAVLELLDLINTKHRLGLILNSALPPAGQCPVFAIESTSGALLKSLPAEDQPAFAFYNGWFLLASNGAGLRKLLLNFQYQPVPADNDNNWLKQANDLQTKAFIRIDPGKGGKALRFALMVSSIKLSTDEKNPSNQTTIKTLKAARTWLEDIGNLKNCAAWMESEDGKTVLRLEIGRKHSDNKH